MKGFEVIIEKNQEDTVPRMIELDSPEPLPGLRAWKNTPGFNLNSSAIGIGCVVSGASRAHELEANQFRGAELPYLAGDTQGPTG